MALIKKDVSTMAMPLTMQRTEPAPIDAYSIWYSLSEAQEYAAGTGTNKAAYVGQIIVVVDEANSKATAYVIADTAGTLQEVGSGSSSPMMFVADEAAMLALTDIEAGQQVYREDKKTVWIFKGGDPSQLSNWVESASQNDTVWSGTENKVIFSATTQSVYDALTSKDNNTLYFVTDSGKIYKGSDDVTKSVVKVTAFPDADKAVRNVIYVGPSPDAINAGNELRISDGTSWTTINPGYYTDGANWASADSGKLATIGLIKTGINEVLDTFKTTSGLAHNITYDAAELKITIPQYGSDDLVINIPKDKFVTAGKYYENYPEENPTQHKVIVLTIDNQTEPVIIPAEALVNIYTADNTDKDVIINITDDNKISAHVKVKNAVGNRIIITQADGSITESEQSLDDFIKSVTGIKDNIVTFGDNNTLADSGRKAGGATLSETPNENTLATESAVASILSWTELQ